MFLRELPKRALGAIKKKMIPQLHSIMGFDTNALNETLVNSIATSLNFKRVRKSSHLGFSIFRHISRGELVCCVFHESQLVILHYGRLNLSDLRVIFRKGHYYRRCDTRKFQDILKSFSTKTSSSRELHKRAYAALRRKDTCYFCKKTGTSVVEIDSRDPTMRTDTCTIFKSFGNLYTSFDVYDFK